MQQFLALDLKDDHELIARYEAHHRLIWPEVAAHLREHGVLAMKIYRLGTRLAMWMETDDTLFDAERFAAATHETQKVREWEALMDTFQAPTPWTLPGEKWMPMHLIFDLAQQR
ncbi:L-fucose mutarotase [Burkholderia lata]|uniref:L-rhamnose mutarotase n=1 Tax=Burkholderia lata (strain ATCC 17760 / DSM 23089 / LMG 22485 / NCIMB 9086 / R18194 / 383) TaxID=482957 RepID=UPI0014543D80|nr:L-rhamnose mutarotase [Burkholderia lata]VWC41580.1 L-fucose mutarotase [Burkholderia lata]